MKLISWIQHFAIAGLILFILTGCAPHPAKQATALDQGLTTGSVRELNGWLLVENSPAEIKYRVLLLPGLLCTDLSYADLLGNRKLAEAGVKLVAGDPPGFKGLPAKEGFDYSIESYAREVECMNASEPFDLIVGHSFSGNVLIEVAARGNYPGKLMVLSPTLYRGAEEFDMRSMSHLAKIPVIRTCSMWASYRIMGSFYRPCMSEENSDRVPGMIKEGRKTPLDVASRQVASFFNNIDQYGDLTGRLLSSKNQVWYVRGDLDHIGFSDQDRSRLNGSANVRVKDIPGGRHLIMIDRPDELSALILDMLTASQ